MAATLVEKLATRHAVGLKAGDIARSGDFITALLAEAFLLKQPGATVIYDLRASHAVKDTAARYGSKALMNRVGHAFFNDTRPTGTDTKASATTYPSSRS